MNVCVPSHLPRTTNVAGFRSHLFHSLMLITENLSINNRLKSPVLPTRTRNTDLSTAIQLSLNTSGTTLGLVVFLALRITPR